MEEGNRLADKVAKEAALTSQLLAVKDSPNARWTRVFHHWTGHSPSTNY